MRLSYAAGLVCSATIVATACVADADPTNQQDNAVSGVPPIALAAGGECGPPTRPSGLIVEQVSTPAAFGVAVRDDGLTYYTELFNAGVGITSTLTRTVDGFIATGSLPIGVAFAPEGHRAYVSNLGSQYVSVIDVATAQQIAQIFTPAAPPVVLRVSPDGSRLFVSTASTTVYIVDTETREIIGSVEVGFIPNGFAVHPDERIIYVSAALGGTVTEVDIFTGTVLRTFVVGGTPQDMAITRNGRRLYVGNEAGFLQEIELLTGAIAATIPLSGGAFGIGVTPDDTEAYISLAGAGRVEIFNLQQRRLTRQLEVGGTPRRIAFSRRGHIGAIANEAGFVTFVR